MYYVEHCSLWLDIKILFRTVFLCNQKGWGTIIRTYVRNMMKKLDLNSIKISLIIPTLNAADICPV